MGILRRVTGAVLAAAAVVLSGVPAPAALAHSEPRGNRAPVTDNEPLRVAGELIPPVPDLTVRGPDEAGNARRRGQRPPTADDPSSAVDRVTAPRALVGSALVSAIAVGGHEEMPLLLPRSALPWRFFVDRALAQRFGETAVAGAAAQWDGIAGSRWATAYGGVVDGVGPAPDGRSVIFAKTDCPGGTAGYTYWQTDNARGDSRYGTAALYLIDVDIAVCASVGDVPALRSIVAHEVGHAFGLAHLCNPGEPCHASAMGTGHSCRVMYWAPSACRHPVNAAEHDGAIHVYPTLQRLSGPTRIETAARASFASFDRFDAPTVVLARADRTAHGPLAASALAGGLGGPLLLAAPGQSACVSGTAATELTRAAAEGAPALLVGDWPASCIDELARWDLDARLVGGPAGPVLLGLAVADALADSGRLGEAAVLVSASADAGGHVPDGVAGGAAAGRARGPVLYTGSGRLDPAVASWLRAHRQVHRVYVLGGQAALSDQVVADLRTAGVEPIRVAGPSRVETALALANRSDLFGAATGPVVVATADSWADAVTGSSMGAGLGAPVLVSPRAPHGAVQAWLAAHRPAGGYLVGGAAALPYELQWDYARLVR